ncbi:MAG: FtsX-like permease family protein [Butyrivibrio sp.]
MFGLVFRNIRNSFKAYRNIYVLMLVSQCVAVVMLLFVYGITVSYDIAKEEERTRYQDLEATFETGVSTQGLVKVLPEILDEMEERLCLVYATGKIPDKEISLTFHEEYHEGQFSQAEITFTEERLLDGRYLTTEEMNDGSKVAVAHNAGEVGDTILIGDTEFELVGKLGVFFHPDDVDIFIPLSSAPEEMVATCVCPMFKKFPTLSDYNHFKAVLEREYGSNVEVKEFEPVEVDDIIAYDSIIILAAAIGVVTALDTMLLYGYLMKKRKRQMAIFGITGAKRGQQILINELEITVITLLAAVLGVVIFRAAIEGIFTKVYEVGMPIFSIKAYGIMLGIYGASILGGTLIITLINSGQKVLDMRRTR